MTPDLGIILAIVGAILGVVFSVLIERYLQQNKKRLEETSQAFKKELSKAQAPLIEKLNTVLMELPKDVRAKYIQTLVYSQRSDGSFPELTILPPSTATKEEIGKLIDKQISTLRTRIEEVEKRFPSEATLDKISSVNDAILATKVENLANSIEELNRKLLTKWDVAKVIFQVIGGLGALAAIILAVTNLLSSTAGP